MEGYKAIVSRASRELSVKEKIMLKDMSDAEKLDDLVKDSAVIVEPELYAIINVHNEKSDTKDYTKIVIIDKEGKKYTTGSMPFIASFLDLWGEMTDAGEEDFTIKIYPKESKNYKGKYFITCSLI